ncbi:MAG: trigger factor [Candidatus Pacebacteria bacterium]|nr:trigger factor [Candidatus Paceibacterota bacterium]
MTKESTKKPAVKKDTKKAKSPKAQAPELIVANTQISIVIPIKEAKVAYEKMLRKLAPQVKTTGFRKGKVPPHVAEEVIGKVNIVDRVLQELVPELYSKAIKDSKKIPLTHPDIRPVKLTMEEDWELVAEIGEKPVFKLGDYKKIAKNSKKDAVKEIKEEEKKIHDHSKDLKEGDKAPKGHEGKHTHKMTDKQKEDMTLSIIFRNLVQEFKPQIQEIILRDKVKTELGRLEQDLKQINTTLEDYLKKQGKSFEQFSQQLAVMHLGQVQLEFILQEIIEAEKLTATEKEIKAKIEDIKGKLHAEALKEFDEAKYQHYFVTVIEREKVIDFLLKL